MQLRPRLPMQGTVTALTTLAPSAVHQRLLLPGSNRTTPRQRQTSCFVPKTVTQPDDPTARTWQTMADAHTATQTAARKRQATQHQRLTPGCSWLKTTRATNSSVLGCQPRASTGCQQHNTPTTCCMKPSTQLRASAARPHMATTQTCCAQQQLLVLKQPLLGSCCCCPRNTPY
jgi:hypothetical protein